MWKKYLMHGCIALGLLIMIVVCGYTATNTSVSGKSPSQPDPETGIIAWIDGMNAHDVSGLYNLAPEGIRD